MLIFIDQNYEDENNASKKTTELKHRRGSLYDRDNYEYDYYEYYEVQPQGNHYYYSSLIERVVKGKNR